MSLVYVAKDCQRRAAIYHVPCGVTEHHPPRTGRTASTYAARSPGSADRSTHLDPAIRSPPHAHRDVSVSSTLPTECRTARRARRAVRSYVGLGGKAGRAATVMLFPVLTPGGAHATRSDPPTVWQRLHGTGSYIIPGLRAGQSRVDAGMHHRLWPAATGADDRRARPRGPGDRALTGAAALRAARRCARAQLLRSRARWLLAAPRPHPAGRRESRRGFFEHRDQSARAAREVGPPGRPQVADDAAPLRRGRDARLARGPRPDTGGGGSAAVAPGAALHEAGSHPNHQPDQRLARRPGRAVPYAPAVHRATTRAPHGTGPRWRPGSRRACNGNGRRSRC